MYQNVDQVRQYMSTPIGCITMIEIVKGFYEKKNSQQIENGMFDNI